MTTFYAVLGVNPEADTATIRRAYRALAWRHHPDFGGDTRAMVAVNDAWHVLRDRDRRASYDRTLRRPTPPRSSDDRHTVMDFGQYEGSSLADIARIDENYLLWLRRMPIGRRFQREIDELLAERTDAEKARRPAPAARRRRGLFSA
jgi:molecular chaperone DnaJ